MLKIGDTIYRFDINRRVYQKDANGRATGSPIYREHFSAHRIDGETKFSWLADGFKINKKTMHENVPNYSGHQWYTADEMEGAVWMHEHRHQIMRAIERAPITQLRQIAELVGYEPR